jgi:hypothetical protein
VEPEDQDPPVRAGLLFALAIITSVAAGCATRASCLTGHLEPPSRAPRFVVLRSDYGGASALALLDGDDQLIDDDWVDSGTRVSSLVTAISGDVVVPSTPLGGIAWIDRFAVDVLTIAQPDGGIEQIDLLGASDGMHDAFTSNPHDALRLDDGRILVTRHNRNLSPDAGELSRGNDVIVIDDGHVTASIDLQGDEGDVLARPDVLLPLVAGTHHVVLVTLTRLDARYMSAASGAAVVLDEMLRPSPVVTFGALQNCVSASVDPDDASRAYVLCSGLALEAMDDRRPHAGIVELTLSEEGVLEITGMAVPDASGPVPTNGLIALGSRRVLAVAYGQLLPTVVEDRLIEIDVAAGTTRDIWQASRAAFVLGDGTFDAANGVALVPDAETNAVLRFEASTATFVDAIELGGCVGVPPREIGPL